MRVRSILTMSTMLLLSGPALASYQGTQGGNSGAGGVSSSDASPSGGHITAPDPVPGPAPEGRMHGVDPGSFGRFSPRGAPALNPGDRGGGGHGHACCPDEPAGAFGGNGK